MTRRTARTLSLATAVMLLAGCESIPMPFAGTSSSAQPAPVATPAEPQKQTLSRAEKISRGLSEELDWFPSLKQPLDQLEGVYANEESAAVRNETLSSIAYLYDARLFVLFQDMLDFLHPDARIRELQEQNAWLDRREMLATQAFLQFDDEVEARHAAGQAFIDATRKRIAEIEARRELVIIR